MSQDLRRQLAQRLDAKRKQNIEKEQQSMIAGLSKSKSQALVLNASFHQSASSTSFAKPRKLKPITPFLKSSQGFAPQVKIPETEEMSMIKGAQKMKLLPPISNSKIRKTHYHGDEKLIEEKQKIEQQTPYEFIQVIKNDPELMEDFWYCNRIGDAYDFQLVPFSKKNEEYLTISSRGITHFTSGGASFLSLEEWEREYKLYQRLKEISFFKQYKKWKNFSLWKNLRRIKMMDERAKFLESELFILDDKLRDPILNVREKVWEMFRYDFFDIGCDRVRTVEEFSLDQEQKRTQGAQDLENLELRIKNDVASSCKNSLEAFRKSNKSTSKEETKKTQEDENEPFLVGDVNNKQMPYTQDAIIRTHYKRLTKFIRLCDYHVIDAKINLSRILHSRMKYTVTFDYTVRDKKTLIRRQNQPIFVVKCFFQNRVLYFEPNNEHIKKAIYDATIRGLTILLNNYMLVNAPEFASYHGGDYEDRQADEEFDLLQMIVNDDDIKKDHRIMKDCIDISFSKVIEKAHMITPYLEIYYRNLNMNVEDLANAEVEEIKKVIEEYKKQEEDFNALKEIQDIGMFQLNIENLKKTILPSPTLCMKKIENFLPEVAFECSASLITVLHEANKNLKGYPRKVEDYVHFLKHIKDIECNLQDLTNQVNDLKDLMLLLDIYSIKIEDHVRRKYNETLIALDTLRKKMQSFYERAENDKIRFTRELRFKIVNVDKRAMELKEKLKDERIACKDSSSKEMLELLENIGEKVNMLIVDTKAFNNYQQELEIEPKDFVLVYQVQKDFQRKYDMWKALHEWQHKVLNWNDTAFSVIDVEKISKEVDMYYRIAKKSIVLEEQGNYVPQMLKSKVEMLKDTMPVVVDLRCKSLKDRHWKDIRKELKIEVNINDPKFTLKNLLDLKVNNVKDRIAEISLKARKEEEIEKRLDEVENSWKEVYLDVKYEKSEDYYILQSVDDIISKLEDTQVTLTTLLTNRFLGPLFDRVDTCSKKFKLFSTTFDEWLLCQKQWAELSKIFRSGDIAKKLKDKNKKFQQIDSQFREKMKLTSLQNHALTSCTKDGLLKMLQDWNRSLEKLQKTLEDYLDKQRTQFARFFFLSNDELLIILSNSQSGRLIQPHLKNMFEGIHELEFDEEKSDSILAIVSVEKEKIDIAKGTKAKGNIEDWLRNLEQAMHSALKHKMVEANSSSSDISRKELVMNFPSQIVLAICMIMWVNSTEEALSNKDLILENLGDLFEQSNNYLDDLTHLIKEKLDMHIRRRIVSLITQDVHNRDIIEWIKDEEVNSVVDFKWQQQLRYYWNTSGDNCVIKQINASFSYGYEFLGATSRLVITGLTDRCWMTITGALKLNLGASPSGPSGTGKTESIKDLAKAMGRYCVVFNCSEQITYMMMEKLFMGLCYTGSWTCLDEFNRIDIEVLSVIAQQIRVIKHAKDEEKQEFFFEDKKTQLNSTMGVFITMNPSYIGRTELPDNLKVLFRPISMMVPDYSLIAEVILYAEGFSNAKELSLKMTKLYKLSSDQLSQQDHYDFGMRAMKTVLNTAGMLKRKDPIMKEDNILIKAMKDSNIPKLLKEDLILFNAIIKDLFPSAKIQNPDYGELEASLRDCILQEKLKVIDNFTQKIIQLYETMEVRFGIMIVGPATAGKSTCYKILAKSLTELRAKHSKNPSFQKVLYKVINPKAITMGELYGEYNEITQDWKDGLASMIIREFSLKEDTTKRWVIFDGPVDSLWIENMNTVLDDNMMLCLANQERIKLKPEMRLLFEVGDLNNASPSTVSRCGMVYMNMDSLGWKPIFEVCLQKCISDWSEKNADYFIQLVNNYLPKALIILRRSLYEPIPTTNNSVVMSFCSLFKAITLPEVCPRLNDNFDYFKKYIDKVVVFCLTWGIGGALDYNSQIRYDQSLSSELGIDLPRGSLYDSFVSPFKIGGEYKPWDSIKSDFKFNHEANYFQLLVPTVDTVRIEHLLKYSISVQKPIFITGNTGVGKSVIIYNSLMNLREPSRINPVFLAFSAQTTSQQTQVSIVSKLNPIKKDILGGHGTNKIALMIDDVNMPTAEKSLAQPPIELLRHYCDQGVIYDKDKKFPIRIIDTTLICSAAPPGGGRSILSQRFTRHFHIIAIPDTSEDSMILIFKTILDGFFACGFKQEIQNMSASVVIATISVYQILKSELLPTPSKSHYLFNLRDLSKVFQGMLMTKPLNILNFDSLIKLWIHETMRVFYDRLADNKDKDWLLEVILKQVLQYFKVSITKEEILEGFSIMFVDFIRGDQDMEDREYLEVKDQNLMIKRVYEFLEEYNLKSPKTMELVFFSDAIQHLSRICRILRQQRGNCMLVGVGGCGKQSLARLAAFISHCEFYQVQVSKDYKHPMFRDDIKKLYMSTGGLNPKSNLFLMTDSQIINESFLEDISNVLNSGEIPNMFSKDEIDMIEADLRPIAEKEKINENFFNYFIQRVRSNLHIILCMSPIGDALRIRMRMFPSLVNCCTIDWVEPWPSDALLSVSKNKLLDLPLNTMTKPEAFKIRDLIGSLCVYVHESVIEVSEEFYQVLNRKVYTSPKNYLDMIFCFYKILKEKQDSLNKAKNRYKMGVEQLVQTKKEVAEMEKVLLNLGPVLEKKKKESEELAKTVEIDTIKANKVKEIVEEEEREVNIKAQEIRILQEDAENDLREAMPILDGAIRALQNIDRKQIVEIRTFTAPPELVVYTLEAIAILMEVPTSMESIKKLLQNNFLENLLNFPRDNIKPVTLRKLRNKITANANFTPEKVEVQNVASKSLCQWIYAIENYAKISKEVEPKKKRLDEMNKALSEAMANLKRTHNRLEAELETVKNLETRLKEVIEETNRLDYEIHTTNLRLSRASVLTEGLKDEHIRWQQALEKLSEQITHILGNTFIASASVNYYGPFTGIYRSKLINMWITKSNELGIQVSPSYELQEILSDPIQIREWNINSLPNDSISINNAIIITRSERWPLMIDPQEQGNKWIKKMEEENGVKVVKQGDKDFSRNLELCIKEGYPLVIEDIGETLIPFLDPVLNKSLSEQSPGRYTLHMGDMDIEYDTKFKLYMTSKLSNPHYLPEVSIKVNLINFTVTIEGLEEQLLADIVRKEEPKIESEQNKLIKEISDGQKEILAIEQSILTSLSNNNENILDDAKLIAKLDHSKKQSDAINIRIIASEKTKEDNELAREKYKVVARIGSVLYFVIADMSSIDPMYQFSLNYFSKLFNIILTITPQAKTLIERIELLEKSVIEIVYSNICRGLFNSHKLIFSFLISIQLLKDKNLINDFEWRYLLRGPTPTAFKKSPNPSPIKFSDKTWNSIIFLTNTCKVFINPPLSDEICKNLHSWEGFVTSKEPHLYKLPCPYDEISHFHKLMLVKAFREEKLIYAITDFIYQTLGEKFIKSPPVSMEDLYLETTKRTPIIFILSYGADPMSMVQRLALEKKFSDRIEAVSLGKGQEEKAKKTIERGYREGKWVILQNCHLAKSWMPELDKFIENFEDPKNNMHEDFRLFLTSMPCNYFPIPVLQNGIKMTIEQAKGIQSNLQRSLSMLTEDKIDHSLNSDNWKKLLFSLCMFHAVVQERRKFGPLGWNICYEFNESDLEISMKTIENFVLEQDNVPWEAIRFVIGEINYGGRVVDDLDKRCLNSILNCFLTQEVLGLRYHFLDSPAYYIPENLTLSHLKNYVNTLPLVDCHDIFGMHENSNIAYEKRESLFILSSILSIQPKEKGITALGKTSDQIVDELASKFLEDLPLTLMKSEEKIPIFTEDRDGLMDAMATFLSQEMERYNKLINEVKSTLEDIKKAIKGLVLMTDDLDKMYTSLNENRVPDIWHKVSYPSLKPLSSWLNDLRERVKFLREWLTVGKPKAYWLNSFFFPQGFLTAVLQAFSREHLIPIDTLCFYYEFQSTSNYIEIEEKPDEGVLVYGLYMEGCRWDYEVMQIEDSRPGEIYTCSPLILFVPSEKGSNEPEPEDYYSMPVYKTSERAGIVSTSGQTSNFVVSIDVPTNKKPSMWVMRGAAFLCQLSD
ncbi:hypothetical protein SteCoe_17784 [Stentor coeruleus]|uniref:AAA+ ATPase domain-containing protein n=1 Tax=Stentor coeruleus TaxID=5963 RepID=A0A1R2BYH2_9CILI|nr:hypothetical protein SteCoe_17784 [Stentor coeruleus]